MWPGAPKVTADECVAIGGHCWQQAPYALTEAVWGGRTTVSEQCKHCPANRSGVSREPWEWSYPEGQP